MREDVAVKCCVEWKFYWNRTDWMQNFNCYWCHIDEGVNSVSSQYPRQVISHPHWSRARPLHISEGRTVVASQMERVYNRYVMVYGRLGNVECIDRL